MAITFKMKEPLRKFLIPVAGLIFIASQTIYGMGETIQQPEKTPTTEFLQIIEGNSLKAVAPITEPEKNAADYKWQDIGWRVVTGYSSSPDETDSDPFTTASGQKTRDGIVATNEFPFGTKLLINGKVYEVQDRTHSKHKTLIDIWFPSKAEALEWGKRTLEIKKSITN